MRISLSQPTLRDEVLLSRMTMLTTVGGIVILAAVVYLVYLVLEIHVLTGVPLTTYGANTKSPGAGSWALVTGATDGIGRAFAVQLARSGFNIVLVSRTKTKLEDLGREIQSKYVGIKTAVYPIDFSNATVADYEGLGRAINHLDVAVLVNNVGASHNMPESFLETSELDIQNMVNINVAATMQVTKLVAPKLVARKRGLVLNLGSFAGQWCIPLMATYAGTKSFLIGWTAALGEELSRDKVDVQLLNTFFVVSSMSKIRKSSAMIPSPDSFVKSVLSRIGRSSGALGRPYTLTPWPAHAWLDWATSHLVPSAFLLRKIYGMCIVTDLRLQSEHSQACYSQSRATG